MSDVQSIFKWETQPEMLDVAYDKKKLFIGIPQETLFQEKRISLVPSSVAALTAQGHRVVIESGAGESSNFSDNDYSENGAELSHSRKEVYQADCLVKVAPPTEKELEYLHPSQVLISPIHLPFLNKEYLSRLRDKKVIALAWEYMMDKQDSLPIVRVMSELAGLSAMLTAGELLSAPANGSGILLGGISGVPPAKVVILGAGVVAEFATRAALGLGCRVCIFDDNIYKLMRLQNIIGQRVYTSALNMVYLEKELMDADVAIGAVHSKSGRAPLIVTEELVMKMKSGSVIVDVSIDQGGCFETSEVTNHDKQVFVKHDVIHYCVPNISSRVPRTASVSISNIIAPLLLKAGESGGMDRLLDSHMGLRKGVYAYKGCITNKYISERFGLKHTDVDLLITSRL